MSILFAFVFFFVLSLCRCYKNYVMTDFQFIEFSFSHEQTESSFKCHVIVDFRNVGIAIRKVVNLGILLGYTPDSVKVTCIFDYGLIVANLLYTPKFAFNSTPGSRIASLSPTLNHFSKNFKKRLNNETF